MTKRRERKLRTLITKSLKERELGKQHYGESDRVTDQLLTMMKPGEIVALKDGRRAELVDNFADRNKVFRAHGISKFELKVFEA